MLGPLIASHCHAIIWRSLPVIPCLQQKHSPPRHLASCSLGLWLSALWPTPKGPDAVWLLCPLSPPLPAPASAVRPLPVKKLDAKTKAALAALPVLPPQLEEAADTASTLCRQAEVLARHKFQEVSKWFCKLYTQLQSHPQATPVGGPYTAQPLVTQQRPNLFLTPEGRIKTVVHR
jgi:hypothetical protein